MKFFGMIVIFFAVIAYFLFLTNQDEAKNLLNPVTKSLTTTQPTPRPKVLKSLSFNGEDFEYDYFLVPSLDKLKLISNYETKSNTETIKQNNDCQAGINGGFYNTTSKPIGWVNISGQEIAEAQKNSLFNGFIGIDKNGFSISSVKPNDVTYGLQSGPLLITNKSTVNLQLTRDKRARRMVSAQDGNNRAIFLAVFAGTGSTDGPMLEDLPSIVNMISVQEKLSLVNAINLDGGAAASFFNNDTNILEWQPVGSLWCVTK